jgi:hypothetical protein
MRSSNFDGIEDSQPPSVQSANRDYSLHTLGWKAFQDLCATVASSVLGQTVETFADSNDGGRDGAFHGNWKPNANESLSGSFTIQCKFTAKANQSLRLSLLKEELKKAKRLSSKGLADNYVLFCNYKLSGISQETIESAFRKSGIKGRCLVYGQERITSMIRESAELRMLVPRIYGLGDLGQILDERAYSQARNILSALGGDLSKFVITESYKHSARAISEHNFVLLLGEPASGKSTIAAALALGALDRWNYPTIKARDPDDFVKHWNPEDPRQFFWIDDAFGATQLDYGLISGWNRTLAHVNGAIRKGTRVLLTSRDYIYRSAKSYLKESALPVIRESQVIINVQELSRQEREQILYNHIRLGSQSKSFKKKIKEFLPACAVHEGFSPELARRLGNPLFTKKLVAAEHSLLDFFAEPQEWLQEIIETIDDESRAALSLVFMRGGAVTSPIGCTEEEQRAMTLLGGTESGIRKAANSLADTLLLLVSDDEGAAWKFKHPTIRDAFANMAASNRELLDIYLTGAPIEHIFNEVVCGVVDIQGAQIRVPSDRFSLLLARINECISNGDWRDVNKVYRFLGYRSDREFLKYVQSHQPKIIDSISLGSYLTALPEMDILVKLNVAGLLSEERKKKYLKDIQELAVETPDSGFLLEHYADFFSVKEKEQIVQHVADKLPGELDDIVRNWKFNCPRDEDPEEYFESLIDCLTEYRRHFTGSYHITEKIEEALDSIQEIIEELKRDSGFEESESKFYTQEDKVNVGESARSVFDDVDQ